MITRYYSGVPFHRTPISCVALLFFVVVAIARPSLADVTFPLEVKWSARLAAAPAFAAAFDDDRAYVSLRNDQLVALLIKDGTPAWSVECPMTSAPAAGDGLVYVGGKSGIEGRSAADGQVRWRRPIEGQVSSLFFSTGWLMASTDAGPLLAIRGVDGEVIWQRDLGSPLSAPPALEGDRMYLGLRDGRVIAVSLQNGEEAWTQKFAEPASGILPAGDRVYVGARDKQFHSLDVNDGDVDWRWKTGADVLGPPVLDERRVYFIALDNVLRGHNRNNGTMLWKRVLPMRPFTGPLLSGETLIVPGVASELHAFNARDGQPAGETFVLKGAENEEMLLAAPPHLSSQDLLILITRGGQVRGVGTRSGPAAPAPAPAPGEEPPAGTTAPGTAPTEGIPGPAGAAGTTK